MKNPYEVTGNISDINTVLVNRAEYEELVAERDAWINWLNSNTTFWDVDRTKQTKGTNIPTLASVSKRIWYHATDNQLDFPFSQVVRSAMEKTE